MYRIAATHGAASAPTQLQFALEHHLHKHGHMPGQHGQHLFLILRELPFDGVLVHCLYHRHHLTLLVEDRLSDDSFCGEFKALVNIRVEPAAVPVSTTCTQRGRSQPHSAATHSQPHIATHSHIATQSHSHTQSHTATHHKPHTHMRARGITVAAHPYRGSAYASATRQPFPLATTQPAMPLVIGIVIRVMLSCEYTRSSNTFDHKTPSSRSTIHSVHRCAFRTWPCVTSTPAPWAVC